MGRTTKVRGARFLAVVLVVMGGLAVMAPIASAATNTQYCDAVKDLSAGDAGSSSASQGKALGKSFRSAAATAPRKVKAAMNTIATYYETVADAGTSPAKIAAAVKNAKAYAKASVVWTKYTLKTCSGF